MFFKLVLDHFVCHIGLGFPLIANFNLLFQIHLTDITLKRMIIYFSVFNLKTLQRMKI